MFRLFASKTRQTGSCNQDLEGQRRQTRERRGLYQGWGSVETRSGPEASLFAWYIVCSKEKTLNLWRTFRSDLPQKFLRRRRV